VACRIKMTGLPRSRRTQRRVITPHGIRRRRNVAKVAESESLPPGGEDPRSRNDVTPGWDHLAVIGQGATCSGTSMQQPICRDSEVSTLKVQPFHSVLRTDRPVYHDDNSCTEGNNIEPQNKRPGTGGRPKCSRCKELG
jgi:hypothetical protein